MLALFLVMVLHHHHHHHHHLRNPQYFSHGGGTLDEEEMASAFRTGVFSHCRWNSQAVRRAQDHVTAARHWEAVQIWNNYFDEGCFQLFLQMLVGQAPPLQHLTVSVCQQPLELSALINVLQSAKLAQLKELTLVVDPRQRITDEQAQYLRALVQIPQKTLTIHFGLFQQDYRACLQALSQGQREQLQEKRSSIKSESSCQVKFCNVSFPHHQTLLQRFVHQVVETNVLSSLHLTARRRLDDDDLRAAQVGVSFVESFPVLLSARCLAELEIDALILPPLALEDEPVLLERVWQALVQNTNLVRLSIEASYGLRPLWTRAIFPALALNRTLHYMDFGHTDEILVDFLQRLPTMQGLRYIRAPFHLRCCRSWVYALEQMDNIQRIDFVFGDGYWNNDLPCTLDVRKQINEHCRRNQLIAAARIFLRNSPCRPGIVQQLKEFEVYQDKGFSAYYVVVRGCAGLIAHL